MNHHPTVTEIFRNFKKPYHLKYPQISLHERKVMRSIEICRSEAPGGRAEECCSCGHKVILFNSCRIHHCPQCQSMKKEKLILQRKNDVLPFTYFHIVFTLPDTLNPIVFRNKRAVYDLIFEVSRMTLLSVSADEKYFDADIGFFSILHTWGQKLNLQNTSLINKNNFQDMIIFIFAAEWVVYLKESFQGRESVIEYPARYTHRTAISNHRIADVKDSMVRFKYRDYADKNREKIMELTGESFIRRFMMHFVPET